MMYLKVTICISLNLQKAWKWRHFFWSYIFVPFFGKCCKGSNIICSHIILIHFAMPEAINRMY